MVEALARVVLALEENLLAALVEQVLLEQEQEVLVQETVSKTVLVVAKAAVPAAKIKEVLGEAHLGEVKMEARDKAAALAARARVVLEEVLLGAAVLEARKGRKVALEVVLKVEAQLVEDKEAKAEMKEVQGAEEVEKGKAVVMEEEEAAAAEVVVMAGVEAMVEAAEMVMEKGVEMITMVTTVTPVESDLDLAEEAALVGSIKNELPIAKRREDL